MKVIQKNIKPILERAFCEKCNVELTLMSAQPEAPKIVALGKPHTPVVMFNYECPTCHAKEKSNQQYPHVTYKW